MSEKSTLTRVYDDLHDRIRKLEQTAEPLTPDVKFRLNLLKKDMKVISKMLSEVN